MQLEAFSRSDIPYIHYYYYYYYIKQHENKLQKTLKQILNTLLFMQYEMINGTHGPLQPPSGPREQPGLPFSSPR